MPKAGYKSKKPKLTAVGAYVFAGGFTIGVKKHFDVLCHLEESNYGVATARRNFTGLSIHVGIDSWPIDDLANRKIDFVYGNPPCAAWSQAGSAGHRGGSWVDSPLVDCTRRHFDLLKTISPRVWAWESVQNAWTKGESFVRELADVAADLGYSTTVWLHDAAHLGVPQHRRRFFMICHDVELAIPKKRTHLKTIDEALFGVVRDDEPVENNIKRSSNCKSCAASQSRLSSSGPVCLTRLAAESALRSESI